MTVDFVPIEYQHIYAQIGNEQQKSFQHSMKTAEETAHHYITLANAILDTIDVYGDPSPYWYFLFARISFVSTEYERLEDFYKKVDERYQKIMAPFVGRIKAFQNAYEEAIELANFALSDVDIANEPSLLDIITFFEGNFTLGLSYAYTRQFDLAEKVISILENTSSEYKYKKLIGEDHMLDYVFIENIIKGYASFFAGKAEEMADVLNTMREWTVNLKDPWLQGFYYNIFGISRIMFQELAEGERALRVAFKKFEEVHDLRGYSTVGANLGMSLLTKGKRAEGRNYLEAVIGPQISMKNYWLAMGNLLEVAKSYLDEQNEEEARQILTRAENLAQTHDIGDPNTYSMFTYYFARMGELDKSTEFLQKLKKIKEEGDDDQYADLFYYMGSAINAMHQGNLQLANMDISKGIQIADKAKYFNYALELSMVHLEIILKRYLVEQKNSYILKALEVVRDLEPLISMTENPFYETLFHLLTAYLFLAVENYSDAREHYDLAEAIALDNEETAQYQEINLYEQRRSFITRARPTKDVGNVLFDEFVNNWLSDEYLPIFYTIESKRLLQNLQFEKTSLEQKKEEFLTPKLLFIVGAGGITVYSHRFDEDESLDEVLVGGFLSALTTFSQELFGGGMLTRIDQENHVLLMEKISETNILVMIVEKETYSLRKKFKMFSSELAKMKIVEYLNTDQVLGEHDPQFQILEGIVEMVFVEENEDIQITTSEAKSSTKEKQETIESEDEPVEEGSEDDRPVTPPGVKSEDVAMTEDTPEEEEVPAVIPESPVTSDDSGEDNSNVSDDTISESPEIEKVSTTSRPEDEIDDVSDDEDQTQEDLVDEEHKEDYVPSFKRYENE